MSESDQISPDLRCNRNDGRRWRCPFPRYSGSNYCEKHHLYLSSKNKAKPVKNRRNKIRKERKPVKTVKREENHSDDAHRCARTGWNGWRCRFPRSERSPYCEKHERKNQTIKKGKAVEALPKVEEDDTVRVFSIGEIWAFSEEPNGIAGFYARINRTIPGEPVMIQVTPLLFEPVLPKDFWLAKQGISSGCGVFRLSKLVLMKECSSFSHKVPFEMEGAFYKIFPSNGEIWAVYWDCDVMGKKYEYKFVEVVSDYSEEDGVCVFGLAEVEHRKGTYKRAVVDGFELYCRFSRPFMSMFSHQIPVTRIDENGQLIWETLVH